MKLIKHELDCWFESEPDSQELVKTELQLLSQEESRIYAEQIDAQYRKKIALHSDYHCDLWSHIYFGYGSVFKYKDSFLVGYLQEGVFIVSHFAPASMKQGVEMMRELANGYESICFAIPFFMAKQAIKLGFEWIGSTHQLFAGHACFKHVFVNKRMSDSTVRTIQSMIERTDVGMFKPELP